MEKGTEFRSWYFDTGWGDSWGILVFADEEMKVLHKHFRRFLMVKTEDGEELYFRFYDPRVLRIFFTYCNKEQLKEFFGPVDYYICEVCDPGFGLVFSLQDGLLNQGRITKEMVMGFEPPAKKKDFRFFNPNINSSLQVGWVGFECKTLFTTNRINHENSGICR